MSGTSTFVKGAVTALLGYLVLVRTLRFRRYREIHEKYRKKYEDRTLTPEEAQKIVLASSAYDMPFVLGYCTGFVLLKTNGIPSISRLLLATKEIKSPETASKRFADAKILLFTWIGCPISGYVDEDKSGELDPRAMIALARTNYLHSRYKISNSDYLYTLTLFATEPVVWAAKYGWRELSSLEKYAYCVFWREIGRRMGIQDIPETPEEMERWATQYEEEYMKPAQVNKEVVDSTIEELARAMPKAFGIRDWLAGLMICLLEERARIAMMQPEQPPYKHLIVRGSLRVAAFIQKWFMLPRSDSNYKLPIRLEFKRNADGSINPRNHPVRYQVRPWYKPEAKTSFGKALDKLAVKIGLNTEVPGPSLRSEGYRLEEMGPLYLEKTANDEVLQQAGDLLGCPIIGPFAGH